jgi:hypothetical protein
MYLIRNILAGPKMLSVSITFAKQLRLAARYPQAPADHYRRLIGVPLNVKSRPR